MKLALIEDRIGRLEQYVAFDIKNCENVVIISGSNFDDFKSSLEQKNPGILNQYDCIAVHKSALSGYLRDTLIAYCKSNSKPLIFFSGGITSSIYTDKAFPLLHINSKEFYSNNLKLFIDDFNKHNKINLLILQFGTRWELSLLMELRNKISVFQNKLVLQQNNPEVQLDSSEKIRRIHDLNINSDIRDELIYDQTKDILSLDDSALISTDQINIIKSVINHVLYKLV